MDTNAYEIVTMASGQQFVMSTDPAVTVTIHTPDDTVVNKEAVILNDAQLAEVMKAAETNDIPSDTIEANKVSTTENMQTTDTTDTAAE